jgi:diacylglycerol kinase
VLDHNISLRKFFQSFAYAWQGIRWMLKHQQNMRFHLMATAICVIAGISLGIRLAQWTALVFAITVVLVAEALNSAVEAVMDLIHPDHNEFVKIIKDVMAGAALLAAAGAATIGCLVFIPRIIYLIHH